MNSIKTRVAYLKGLIDGLGISQESKEGRVILEIADILSDISNKIDDMEDIQLGLEDYIYNIEEDSSEDDDKFFDEDDDIDFEDDFDHIACPKCNEIIYVEKTMIDNSKSIKCPNCQFDLLNTSDNTSKEVND